MEFIRNKKCIILSDCHDELVEEVLNLAQRGTLIILNGKSLFGCNRQSFNIIERQEAVGEIVVIPALVSQLANVLVLYLEYYCPGSSQNVLLVDRLIVYFANWLIAKTIQIRNQHEISYYLAILHLANQEMNLDLDLDEAV